MGEVVGRLERRERFRRRDINHGRLRASDEAHGIRDRGFVLVTLALKRWVGRSPPYIHPAIGSSTGLGISTTSSPFIVKSTCSGTASLLRIMNSESSSSM